MKKIFVMLVSILVINACSSTKNAPFNEVETIVEKDRRSILNKFESFRTEVRDLKKNRKNPSSNETRVLNSFIDKSSTNIQYLNDLGE